ncbi:hypothetical protein WDZ17_14815 [Pseudokineococcus basanitobsidens]|uniref:Uncharacterized protein n=1 Tax=Pseudokineococcus basanitobsidens TaxID=1926649 RepID=A0ABU8RN91_9ACTN
MSAAYPAWSYFPRNTRPPQWAHQLVDAVSTAQPDRTGMTSDTVLAHLAADLQRLCYTVEAGKRTVNKSRHSVLFEGDDVPTVSYEVEAAHGDPGIVVEVEVGRGARGNAAYRDITRTSLILDARYLDLLTPRACRYSSAGKVTTGQAYRDASASSAPSTPAGGSPSPSTGSSSSATEAAERYPVGLCPDCCSAAGARASLPKASRARRRAGRVGLS